jgi:two-component system, OmpR family, response regulator
VAGRLNELRHTADEVLRVVLVEDDERLGRLTSKYLESHGVLVTWAQDGKSGLAEVLRLRPDAVLLDLQLPGLHGISVCRELRAKTDVPILIITARDEEADLVLGLELGADDYVAKPFSSRELLARVRAQVRRARGRVGPSSKPIEVGELALDPASLKATLGAQELALTAYEFTLLKNVSKPFFRTDKSRARRTGGLGLGLSLSRRIVEAHAGQLAIASELGKGTTVRITLPA